MSTKLGTVLADFTTNLATAIIVGGTSATLQSAVDDDGVALPSGRYFFTLDGANSNKEHLSCDLAGTAISNIKSVSRQGVETVGLARAHRIGCTVTLTDFAHLLYQNNLLSGTTLFNSLVKLGYDADPAITSSDLNYFATVKFVNSVAIAGASNASTTVKGIVEMATLAELLAKTPTGGTGAVLAISPDIMGSTLLSDYKVDTGIANAYVITPIPAITAYVDGQRFVFKAANANTGISTLTVSGLTATTIKKNGSLDLSANDIIVGQIVEVMIVGANAILMTPTASNFTPTGMISPYAGIVLPTGWLLCDGSAISRTTYAALFGIISPAQTFTVTIASPAVISAPAHGLQIGDKIRLTTTGALPTNLAINTDYFVISAGFGVNAFEISATRGGAAINTTGTQSGVHTLRFSNYGIGDGSTTFNIPDLRGSTIFGQKTSDTNFDNLNVPTVYVGEKTHQLIIAEMPAHTHNLGNNVGGGSNIVNGAGANTNNQATSSTGGDGAHNNMPPYAVMQYIIKI